MSVIQAIGPGNARIAIVGEFPTEVDLQRGSPFCGTAGMEFSKMLAEADMHRESCYVTLAVNERVRLGKVESLIAVKKKDITSQHVHWNGKWVMPELLRHAERLKAELMLVNPNVVCAVGNLAMFVLTGQWGVNDWRSSIMESTLVPGMKVIPTLTPNVLHAQWRKRPIIVHDLKRVKRESATPGVIRKDYKFVIRMNFATARDTLLSILEKCHSQPGFEIGADIETRAGHIACIAFAWSETEAICIPLMCQHSPEGYWTLEEETALVRLMCQILTTAHIVGQNWNYDEQYNHKHWAALTPTATDTMLQQHSCFSNLDKNLAFLSSMYLEDHFYWKDDRTNWVEGPKGEGEDVFWRYNCMDAVRTLAIKRVLDQIIVGLGMQEVNAFQQRLRPAVLQMMLRGVRFDHTARQALSHELLTQIAIREDWLEKVVGEKLNIKSPKQMQQFFYSDMGQKEIRKRRSDGSMSPTTDDEALHKIASREPILLPVTRKIAELRSLGVFHSTFVQARTSSDGRMRTSFNIAGTETYRFSSSTDAFDTGINYQNIPKGGETEDGGLVLPNIRKLSIPDPGMTMFDIDLDSADLRIVTWESDCKWMKEHFKAGRKPYVEVMKEYYKNPAMTKNSHPREYAMFKALCHGTNYLGTADGLAPRLGLLVHEVERIQKWYFGLAPEIARWQSEIKKQVSGRRYVENAWGYRNYFFDKIEGTIFNQAVAWIPQSSVGILINHGLVNIHEQLPEAQLLLQVHDSLVGQVPTARKDELLPRIVELCAVPIPFPDPLVIPVGIVSSETSWGDCD
jgi:DNA polymerase I-like protein with 3'-5' exonuclease and polymerase domains/uracil-DNA glycosylase